jgi:hypothetical protein
MEEKKDNLESKTNNEILFHIKQLESDHFNYMLYLLIWKQKHKNLYLKLN